MSLRSGIQNIECVDSFTYFFVVALLGLLAACNLIFLIHTQKTNKRTKKKTGNFNRGECLGSPHTGNSPARYFNLTIISARNPNKYQEEYL